MSDGSAAAAPVAPSAPAHVHIPQRSTRRGLFAALGSMALAGMAAGAVGGVGVYWGIDFALNRADAALNREDFEAQALDVIARTETAIAEAVRRQVQDDLGARLVRLVGGGGCGVAARAAP